MEVANVHGAVALRDSKNPTGPVLMFHKGAFSAFVTEVKNGRISE